MAAEADQLESKKNLLGGKRKNYLDTNRPSHGRTWGCDAQSDSVGRLRAESGQFDIQQIIDRTQRGGTWRSPLSLRFLNYAWPVCWMPAHTHAPHRVRGVISVLFVACITSGGVFLLSLTLKAFTGCLILRIDTKRCDPRHSST